MNKFIEFFNLDKAHYLNWFDSLLAFIFLFGAFESWQKAEFFDFSSNILIVVVYFLASDQFLDFFDINPESKSVKKYLIFLNLIVAILLIYLISFLIFSVLISYIFYT